MTHTIMKTRRSSFLCCLALLLCANRSHALTPDTTPSTEDDTPTEISQTATATELKIDGSLAALGLLSLGLAVGAASAEGSGGGAVEDIAVSSGTDFAADVPTPPPTASFPVFPSTPPALSAEYTPYGSTAHQQINTIWPHSVGIKGAGMTVAVVGTGIRPSEIFGSRLLPGIDVTQDRYAFDASGKPLNGLVDPDGYGSIYPGIIAAGLNGMTTVGVAPEANIVPIRFINADYRGGSMGFYEGISTSGPLNAQIYNMGIATGGDPNNQAAITWLADNSKIGVVPAANLVYTDATGTASTISNYLAQSAIESFAQGSIIVVGSVDANNQLSSFSAPAGNTAAYYLVAPGENIVVPFQPGVYPHASGLAIAPPMVSGAAALVWGNWPYLSPQSVVQILLQSATPIGPSEIYGHGLLNLKAAFEPIGTFTMPLPNNNSSLSYGSSAVRTPAGTRITSSSTSQVVFFDSFNRGFYVPSSVLVGQSVAPSFSAQQLQSPIGSARQQRQQFNNFTLSYQGNSSTGYGDMRLDYQMNDNASLALFSGPWLAPFSLTEALNGETLSFNPDAFANPYLQQMTRPAGFALNYAVNEHTRLMFGSAMSDSGQAASWIQAQVQYGGLTTQLQVGNLVSDQMAPQTAQNLTIGASSQAQFAGISLLYRGFPHWIGVASYMIGNQQSQQTQYNSSLQLTSRTASFGLFREAVISEQDRLGIALILPPKIANGTATTTAVVDYDHTTGTPIYGQVSYGLDSVQERVLELSYLYPDKNRVYGLSLGQRFNPNGQTDVPSETVVSARYITHF